MEGVVKAVIVAKRFGFIRAANSDKRLGDFFFHENDLAPGLVLDEQLAERPVQFDGEATHRGPRAHNVRPLD